MRVLIATDAWHPQVNGVVRSLETVAAFAAQHGTTIDFLTPADFRTVPLPGYREIRLALAGRRCTAARIAAFAPDHLHIATEGPIGLAVRAHALRAGSSFTTSYHTRFPEYLAARLPVPLALSYAYLRRFHNAAAGTMVSAPSLERDLAGRGFTRLMRWSRGVDLDLFRPQPQAALDLPRPIFLYVGRIAVEKNIEALLRLDLPGSTLVVGEGPDRARLQRLYPQAHFFGARYGAALAAVYAGADVFVFPSRTDTFGIVLLEALASGLAVAAYPVTGPLDVIGHSGAGILDADLRVAALAALAIPRARCRDHAATFTWAESARQFFGNIAAAHATRAPAPPASVAFDVG